MKQRSLLKSTLILAAAIASTATIAAAQNVAELVKDYKAWNVVNELFRVTDSAVAG